MLITHATIPADDTARAAAVLSDIVAGKAVAIRDGVWIVSDRHGETEIAVIPRAKHAQTEIRIAICLDRPAEEIIEIAQSAGWRATLAERDGGFSSVVEIWVEGAAVIDCLDPLEIPLYRERGAYLDERRTRRVA